MKELLKQLHKSGIPIIKVFHSDIIVSKRDLIVASNIRNKICPQKDSNGFYQITIKCKH